MELIQSKKLKQENLMKYTEKIVIASSIRNAISNVIVDGIKI